MSGRPLRPTLPSGEAASIGRVSTEQCGRASSVRLTKAEVSVFQMVCQILCNDRLPVLGTCKLQRSNTQLLTTIAGMCFYAFVISGSCLCFPLEVFSAGVCLSPFCSFPAGAVFRNRPRHKSKPL